MKTVLVSLNSKYIHSSLAPWYLKAYCGAGSGEIKVVQFTINDTLDSILQNVYLEKADIAAFSCYIWNIQYALKLAAGLKKVSPRIKIILGGPEVSFDSVRLMETNTFIDYIISGEGERTFKLLLGHFSHTGPELQDIAGLTYRNEGTVISNGMCPLIEDLDEIPSPYSDEMLEASSGRIIYFESSRGCPFSCIYCISSTIEGVRYFSLERVEKDLARIMKCNIRQVKFVDRTFNCNRERAKHILKFIIENPGDINFHFEAAADLFDDEMLDILSKAPPGLIQFEIGVQSTNPETLKLIERVTKLDRVFNNVAKLKAFRNIHLHLDLIAGLPAENYDSFTRSFNRIYSLEPHQLQLGFLKMLKGSKVRAEAEQHEYKYNDYPPYEVLSNRYIAYDELIELKGIEELVERYYNSGKFIISLQYIIEKLHNSPFEFYRSFLKFNSSYGYLDRPLSGRELYTVLLEFIKYSADNEEQEMVNELLKLDYLSSDRTDNLPEGINREFKSGFKEKCFNFLRNRYNLEKYLRSYVELPAKQIIKQVHFEIFRYDVLDLTGNRVMDRNETVILFDHGDRDAVTGLYRYVKIGKVTGDAG